MIQDIGRYTVRVRGRYTMDGGMLWMASSLSEIGFRVSEAKILQVMLQADDTVSDPEPDEHSKNISSV